MKVNIPKNPNGLTNLAGNENLWVTGVIPNAVISGRSFQENFLYLSMNGIINSDRINNPGHKTPVTNLSY